MPVSVKNRLLVFLPLVIFALMALMFYGALQMRETRASSELESVLVGRAFPPFNLPDLNDRMRTQEELIGQVTLVNVWGSWCPACRDEHPYLADLVARGVPLVGLNYKDTPENARNWLDFFGDIYLWHVQDQDGRLGLDLGVYGAPETFIVDKMGVVRYKRVGVVDERIWEQEMKSVYLRFGGVLTDE